MPRSRADPTAVKASFGSWRISRPTSSPTKPRGFIELERVTLQEMPAAAPLVTSFSQRFLREMMVFPYRSADDRATLAVADPTDMAVQRAAQIVLGAGVTIKVASSEDIAMVLNQRLDVDDADATGGSVFTTA